MMLFIMCHFFVKAIVFFELVAGIYFSILTVFSYEIIYINKLLYLQACNLNVSRM